MVCWHWIEFFQIHKFLSKAMEKWHAGSKNKEFMYIAIDVATTPSTSQFRIHLQNAFKYGATKEEILEVYQLVSVLGMHHNNGCAVLIEEMDAAGLGGEVDRNFSPRQLAIKEKFIKHRGIGWVLGGSLGA